MNFGDSSRKTVEMPDCFRSLGPKRAPPVGIGLKKYSLREAAQCSKMDLLKNERACVSGCDFHKVHTLGVSKMFLSNS